MVNICLYPWSIINVYSLVMMFCLFGISRGVLPRCPHTPLISHNITCLNIFRGNIFNSNKPNLVLMSFFGWPHVLVLPHLARNMGLRGTSLDPYWPQQLPTYFRDIYWFITMEGFQKYQHFKNMFYLKLHF